MKARERIEWMLDRRSRLKRLFCNDRDELRTEAIHFFAWMERFCYVSRPTYKQNPVSGAIDTNATFIAEGRREVWIELQRLMNLDTKKLMRELKQLEEDETWQNNQ